MINFGDVVRVRDNPKDYVVVGWYYSKKDVRFFFEQYWILTECMVLLPLKDIIKGQKPFTYIYPLSAIIENKGNMVRELNSYIIKCSMYGNTEFNHLDIYDNRGQFFEYKSRTLPGFQERYYTLLNTKQGELCRIDGLNSTFIGFEKEAVDIYMRTGSIYAKEPKMFFRSMSGLKSYFTNEDFVPHPVNWLRSSLREADAFVYVDCSYLLENYRV